MGGRTIRDYSTTSFGGADYLSGFSWPPRAYTCSFCKREFRSAQALGGHMNVHRKDRARLRQQSPPRDDEEYPFLKLNPNHSKPNANPDPNPSFLSSSLSSSPLKKNPSFCCNLPSPFSSSLSPSSTLYPKGSNSATASAKIRATRTSFGLRDFTQVDKYEGLKTPEFVRLNLEIGLFRDSKEELDLELRLGTLN